MNIETKRGKIKITASELLEKPYLTEREVSEVTGRALSTLRNDRFLRRNLPYYKVGISGRSIRYKTSEIVKWLEGRRISFDEVAK
jgi:predicted DNA-binding transcriptional regulator AlpA